MRQKARLFFKDNFSARRLFRLRNTNPDSSTSPTCFYLPFLLAIMNFNKFSNYVGHCPPKTILITHCINLQTDKMTVASQALM